MKLIPPEIYWTMYCLHRHVSIQTHTHTHIQCFYCTVAHKNTKRIHKLVKCNNRYTVNLVIHLSLRKETDVQYLEAPNSTHAAGMYRLMFEANTPLKRVYSSL